MDKIRTLTAMKGRKHRTYFVEYRLSLMETMDREGLNCRQIGEREGISKYTIQSWRVRY